MDGLEVHSVVMWLGQKGKVERGEGGRRWRFDVDVGMEIELGIGREGYSTRS